MKYTSRESFPALQGKPEASRAFCDACGVGSIPHDDDVFRNILGGIEKNLKADIRTGARQSLENATLADALEASGDPKKAATARKVREMQKEARNPANAIPNKDRNIQFKNTVQVTHVLTASGKHEFDVMGKDGAVQFELWSQSGLFDGLDFKVQWLPLHRDGRAGHLIGPGRTGEHFSGRAFTNVGARAPSHAPFTSDYGYRLIVNISPQPVRNANSYGVQLRLYAPQNGQLIKR